MPEPRRRPLPTPTPTSAPFWDGLQRGVLRLQRCVPCTIWVYYPRSHCPSCLSPDMHWDEVSARALVPVLARMPPNGIRLGDILAGSGYAHRDAAAWAIPLRAAGAQLIQDLHPHDRGPAEPTRARSSPTATCTARPRPGHCCNSAHCPAMPPVKTPPRTTPRPPNSPGTNSAGSPPATPTATTASPAPPPPAKSAARSGHPQWDWTGTGPRSSPRPRLVPSHGPDPHRTLASVPARRPQPAHPELLEHPAGTEHAARRRRAPA
jgi:hypothetical protein